MRTPLLLVLMLAACSAEPPAKLNIGDAAPTFAAKRLDGEAVQVPGAYAGRPLVIRFWADWCKFCEGEMKAIEPIYRRYRTQGLEVLAVNAGQDQETAAAFVGKLGISYPTLLDPDSATARRFGVTGLPTTYFVDGQGKVAAKQVGEMTPEAFEQQVSKLFGG